MAVYADQFLFMSEMLPATMLKPTNFHEVM